MLYPHNPAAKDALLGWLNKRFKPEPGYKPKSLVCLSGGLDSIALLAMVLQHTDHEVHAHHVEIYNTENRAHAENLAIARVLEYMKRNYRDFTFSTSVYQLKIIAPLERVGSDIATVMFMTSRVNMAYAFTFDLIWTGHMQGVMAEYNEAAAIHAACYTNHRVKPIWAMPFMDVSKFNLYTAIPTELAEMGWSCRTPIYDANLVPLPCNKCHGCGALHAVKRQVSIIKSATERNTPLALPES